MLRFSIIFLISVVLLVHNLPYLIRDQIVIWLLNNGAEKVELEAIKPNWFEGSITIKGLKAEADTKPSLIVNHFNVDIDIDYSLLSEQRILLTNIALQEANVGIKEQGEHLWLGPLDLNGFKGKEQQEDKTETPEEPSQWSVGIQQLQLSDIDWRTDVAGQKHHLRLETGRLADFYLWDQEQPVSIDLKGALNGAPLVLESSSKPLPDEKSSELKVNLKNFPLHSVTAVFLPKLRAHIDLDLMIKARSNIGSDISSVSQTGALRIRNFSFEQDGFQVKHKNFAWNGSVDLGLTANALTSLVTAGELTLDDFHLQQAGNQVELADLAVKSNVSMKGLKQIKVSGLVVDAKGLALQQGKQSVQVDSIALQGAAESPDLSVWDANLVNAAFGGVNLSVAGERLISLANLKLAGLALQHTEQIKLSSIEAQQLQVQGKGGVFTQWNNINAQDIAFKQLNNLSISQLNLRDSNTRVLLSSKRGLTDLDWLLARLTTEQSTAEKAAADDKKAEPVRVKLKQMNLKGKNLIQIVDDGVTPAFKTQLDVSRLNLRSVDTGSKGKTSFDLKAKSKFSTISAQGALELFSGNYAGNWDAEIKGLELPQVSAYSLHYTGYYLQNGQLSLTTKGTIKGRKLDGTSDIRLNKLEVEAGDGELSGEFDQKVSMPLGTAIMILQDNDDNIDLQIPLDGSLDDPQFGYQAVINKLAGKGLKNAAMGYLTKALQPFGALISISQMVMDAQEKGSFITLQPVLFKPAQANLSAESTQYMAKLAEMMRERKGMRLNICGKVVEADQPLIWEALVDENKKRKTPLDVDSLRLELPGKLTQLAEQRNDVVKGELSQKLGVDIERLFSCYPKLELNSKDKPQATLGL